MTESGFGTQAELAVVGVGERDWQTVNAALQAFAPAGKSDLWDAANLALTRLASATGADAPSEPKTERGEM